MVCSCLEGFLKGEVRRLVKGGGGGGGHWEEEEGVVDAAAEDVAVDLCAHCGRGVWCYRGFGEGW